MKRKSNNEIVLLIILIPLFLFASFILSKYKGGEGSDYTVSGKGNLGFSIIYEALNTLNFNAILQNNELKLSVPTNLQVAVETLNFNVNDEYVKSWLESGGNLLLLTTLGNFELPYGTIKEKVNNELVVYTVDKGRVIIAKAKSFTNKELAKDTATTYSILELLTKLGYNKIAFNEYYIYGANESVSLWRDIPFNLKLVLYQCILILILIIFYKGKRFGRIIPLYEEVERVENEYVYSAAALYKKAKCYDVVFDSYLNTLLYEMKKELKFYKDVTKDNFLELWEKENLPGFDKAKQVNSEIKSYNRKVSYRENLKTISNFEALIGILKKRRGLFWEKLRIKR